MNDNAHKQADEFNQKHKIGDTVLFYENTSKERHPQLKRTLSGAFVTPEGIAAVNLADVSGYVPLNVITIRADIPENESVKAIKGETIKEKLSNIDDLTGFIIADNDESVNLGVPRPEKAKPVTTVQVGGVAVEHLRSYIDRVERLEEEKANIANDIKEVYSEAKGNGFDTKTMKTIIRLRAKDKSDLEEEEFLLDTYKRALDME